jgi:hypothetical protein
MAAPAITARKASPSVTSQNGLAARGRSSAARAAPSANRARSPAGRTWASSASIARPQSR